MTDKLRIAGVVRESIVDGPGIRFTVFCQGCPHNCEGCHNMETHDFKGGYDCSIDKIIQEIDKDPLLQGVTFSGGEPACQPEGFLALARKVKERDLNIMMFSGYTFEELMEKSKEDKALSELMDIIDYLVDGRFVLAERDLTLHFRGSRNQRILDMNQSRQQKQPIIVEL
ncbi:MAG: anaerobic ribonucleoside-triphosphate reductase activating protein [Clostridia bacterium]|nr:anaerobic ribonucleoside-triphosphate reductase activating protein [Clostridia bacterium]